MVEYAGKMADNSTRLDEILRRATAEPRALSHDDLKLLVSLTDEGEVKAMRDAAYELKVRHCGKVVSMRGIIEMGNVCSKDCHYCGIRKSNPCIERYSLSVDDVVRLAKIDIAERYASLVLQSGEIESEAHTSFIEECLRRIQSLPGGPLGITLSLGEQEESVYARWKAAGASRYLLRIETSNPKLYAKLHPADHSWARRDECLDALRRCGYQVGTGVMSALPGQTTDDLASDIEYFARKDVDMIGMDRSFPTTTRRSPIRRTPARRRTRTAAAG